MGDGEAPDDVSHAYALEERNLPELRALIERRPSTPDPEPLLRDDERSRETETEEDVA